nr:integrase, catalytic region, zinc finger, CCHC-type, peptidase aspartic, catalytic [Tanacetum cinerariifolium]
MQTQTSNTLHNAIIEAGSKDRPPMLAPGWIDKKVLISEGSPITRIEKFQETYKNVSQDIRDQLNAKAEAVQIILTGIDNDIYSTVDACPNACEMWKAIKRLKQGESINVQDLETNLYWEFRKFTSRDGESLESYYSRFYKMMNELIRNQCNVTNHQVNVQFLLQLQPEWQRSQQAVTRNRGKALVNSPQPIYDQEPSMVAEDDEMSKDKEIDKLMALISLTFELHQTPVEQIRIILQGLTEALGMKIKGMEFRHVARECQKPKRVKDAAYHRKKMLLCKQEEVGIQLNAEQADWRDDTDDDELEDQELEAHYMYMAQLQEVSTDVADSRPIFDDEPLQKVSHDDHYNVFAIESEHPKGEIDQNDDDNDLANERELLASLIEKLKCEIDESKNHNKFLETSNRVLVEKLKEMKDKLSTHQETISILSQQKESQIKLYKTREDKELDKVIALENKVKVLDNIVYKTGQSVQTINMLNNKCRTSFAKPEFLKKAQRANPRLYDIVTAQTLPPNKKSILKNTNVFAPGMYKLHTELTQTRTSQLPQDFRKTEEMVADLRYFNSLELEVDSLRSQLETQKTQFLNEIDRLSREYYYADHMNTILGVYTELDEDLKAQLQDKCIVISELKKLIEKLKGKYVDTKFEKSSVIRQPNAFKSQRPLILGKPTTFSNSFERKDFSKSKSVTQNNVSNDFSKPVTALTLPPNQKSILKNTNVLSPRMYKLHTDHNQARTSQLPQDFRKTNKRLVEIVLFIVDSGCSKHMTGNLKLLINFVEKFLGTVKFGNDQIAPILGYGDLVQGAATIKWVYYVEGLNHNLSFVGQFCDADLEVAFRKSTCYIRDLKGNDLLTDHVSSNLDPECQRMKLEHISLSPSTQCQENVTQADKTVTTSNELDLLFSLMFNELLNGSSKVVSKSSAVSTADAPNQRQQLTTPLNTHTTPAPTCQAPTQEPTVISIENITQAESNSENAQVADDEFINIFCTPVQDRRDTSSRHVDSSNMFTFYQRYPSEHQWTKDHPLEQVIGNPSQSVRTRHQLESDGEMCMFALT